MRNHGSTGRPGWIPKTRLESEIESLDLPPIGSMVERPDGGSAFVTGCRVTPRGVWVEVRPGGWFPLDAVGVSR